jgi:hypothetical protein
MYSRIMTTPLVFVLMTTMTTTTMTTMATAMAFTCTAEWIDLTTQTSPNNATQRNPSTPFGTRGIYP